ncbi:LOW QUALITY PROTEIN: neurogenic locus notch homolog protein 2-like [Argopecten irradians]|uniref:LOW QUALITY PROTEIN: neurogenic locus notch homolog protein 2-like n=1 Tax=Argopecten irradians TaxID=31199 RepID=UPI00372398BA
MECKISNPCIHGGICHNTDGSYICLCDPRWTGISCETDVDECKDSNPCLHGGTCLNSNGSFSCNCPQTWTGDMCDVDVNECNTTDICLNGGSCYNSDGSFSCECFPGWSGQKLQTDNDECQISGICHNKGTCQNTNGSFVCHCVSSWTGTTCQTDENECDISKPCLNNGTCYNTHGSFDCECESGWIGRHVRLTGTNVRTVIHASTMARVATQYNESECHNHKRLVYLCAAQPAGRYTTAAVDVNECAVHRLCDHDGTCQNVNGSYTCSCVPAWTGQNCTEDVDECLSNPCKNTGTCMNSPGSYSCSCSTGWNGRLCEVDVNKCSHTVCLNGGHCINSDGSYTCQCPADWHGNNCELKNIPTTNGIPHTISTDINNPEHSTRTSSGTVVSSHVMTTASTYHESSAASEVISTTTPGNTPAHFTSKSIEPGSTDRGNSESGSTTLTTASVSSVKPIHYASSTSSKTVLSSSAVSQPITISRFFTSTISTTSPTFHSSSTSPIVPPKPTKTVPHNSQPHTRTNPTTTPTRPTSLSAGDNTDYVSLTFVGSGNATMSMLLTTGVKAMVKRICSQGKTNIKQIHFTSGHSRCHIEFVAMCNSQTLSQDQVDLAINTDSTIQRMFPLPLVHTKTQETPPPTKDWLAENWFVVAGAGAGVVFLIAISVIIRKRRKHRRRGMTMLDDSIQMDRRSSTVNLISNSVYDSFSTTNA